MGVRAKDREAADKERFVVARRQGNKRYPTFGLAIPTWLIREISGSEKVEEIEEFIASCRFWPEVTPDGIFYRAERVIVGSGWELPSTTPK